MTIKQRIAAIAGGVATAALLSAAPAQAIDLNNGWALNGKFYFYGSAADANPAVTPPASNGPEAGFHNPRNYVMLKGPVASDLKFKLTLDQRTDSGSVFVKHAYLDKQLASNMNVLVGLNGTPYIPWDEKNFWGYRFVEKSFLDFWGLHSSADLGVSLKGTEVNSKLQYHVSVMNGEGYNNPNDGRSLEFSGRVGFALTPEVQIGAFILEESNEGGASGASPDPSRKVVYAFFGNKQFLVGAQVLLDADDDITNTNAVWDSGDGINIQGRFKLPFGTDSWAFARHDKIDLGTAAATADQKLTILGLSMDLGNGITVAPNIREYDNGAANGDNTSYNVHAQFKF
jgi:hypothetical protein